MQNKDVKNANQSSVGSQAQQPKKEDLTKNPAQKPGSSSSRIDKSDDNFGTSQPNRDKK